MFSIIDKITYKITIIGIDNTNKNTINNEQVIKNRYFILFSFQLKLLNFKENIGISEINSIDIIPIIGINISSLNKMSNLSKYSLFRRLLERKRGKVIKKIVFVGVLSPMNDSLCLVSMLNFANLNMDIKGINKAKNGTNFRLL